MEDVTGSQLSFIPQVFNHYSSGVGNLDDDQTDNTGGNPVNWGSSVTLYLGTTIVVLTTEILSSQPKVLRLYWQSGVKTPGLKIDVVGVEDNITKTPVNETANGGIGTNIPNIVEYNL